MSRLASPSYRRIALLALVATTFTAFLCLASPVPAAHALLCMPGFCEQQATTYYSGPDHKTVVGACACGSCTGKKTIYSTVHFVCCLC